MNQKKMSIMLVVASLMCLLSTGCTQRMIDFTIISTKNIDLSKAASFRRAKAREEGVDTKHIIVIIPTGVPNMKEAVDRAIEKVPGAVALVDGVISFKHFYIPYIYGQQSYVVEGTPLIDTSLVSGTSEGDFMVARMDKTGYVEEFNYVTKQEYEKLRKDNGVKLK